jgi:hypothetical protein
MEMPGSTQESTGAGTQGGQWLKHGSGNQATSAFGRPLWAGFYSWDDPSLRLSPVDHLSGSFSDSERLLLWQVLLALFRLRACPMCHLLLSYLSFSPRWLSASECPRGDTLCPVCMVGMKTKFS